MADSEHCSGGADRQAAAANAAPGLTMEVAFTELEVRSSAEAAEARGVSLSHELKTLVLTTSDGPAAVSVVASARLSLRAVKNSLGIKQAHMMSESDLAKLGLARGAVCPILEPVWSMPQIVSPEVCAAPFVTINNGTLRGYFRFDPSILLGAGNVQIADIQQKPD